MHDLKTKLPAHQRMPSLREILLIASEERRVERRLREGEGWQRLSFTADQAVPVACIGGALAMSEIYANLAP